MRARRRRRSFASFLHSSR